MNKLLFTLAMTTTTALGTLGATAQSSGDATAADTTEHEVSFTAADGNDVGTARLIGTGSGLLIRLDLQDMPADQWVAFHIHENGACDASGNFESAGGHWNVGNTPHGFLTATGPHSGDMPNQYVRADGRLLADVFNAQAFLTGETGNVMGRALVVHGGADDYETQPSGDAGDRIACAVIE